MLGSGEYSVIIIFSLAIQAGQSPVPGAAEDMVLEVVEIVRPRSGLPVLFKSSQGLLQGPPMNTFTKTSAMTSPKRFLRLSTDDFATARDT